MALRACPVCCSSDAKKEFMARSPEAAGPPVWRLIECRHCGLVYLPQCPADESLYSAGYYGKGSGLSRWIFEPFNRAWSRLKARRLLRAAPGRRWLDYGCGRGDLLEALLAEGCEIWGVETQRDSAQELGRRWKGRVQRSLDSLEPPPEGWDGISLYHVLEHLENPRETLQQLRRRAGHATVLFLAVPNGGSWELRLFGDRWFHFDVPRHLQHFSLDHVRRLLEETGWSPQVVHFKAGAYDLFGLFQSLLNLGPGPRNYFYRRLKRGERFKETPAQQGIAIVWNVLALLPAAAAALLITPFLAIFKRSGTFEITARAKTVNASSLDRRGTSAEA